MTAQSSAEAADKPMGKLAQAAANTARNDVATGFFRWLVGGLGTLGVTGVGAAVGMLIAHNGQLAGIETDLVNIKNLLVAQKDASDGDTMRIGSLETKQAVQGQHLIDIDRRLDDGDRKFITIWGLLSATLPPGAINKGTHP